jgi:hypothetical protein
MIPGNRCSQKILAIPEVKKIRPKKTAVLE